MFKYYHLRYELAVILCVKIIILIAIKIAFFSEPVTEVEQAITQQFLSLPQQPTENIIHAQ